MVSFRVRVRFRDRDRVRVSFGLYLTLLYFIYSYSLDGARLPVSVAYGLRVRLPVFVATAKYLSMRRQLFSSTKCGWL